MLKTHCLDLVDGKFCGTTRDDLRDLFRAVATSPQQDHLVVHFHGGLVSRRSALAVAARLQPQFQSSGAYPVFFIWNSDLLTQLTRNFHDIANEEVFRHLLKRVLRLVLGKLAETAATRGDALELKSLRELPDELAELADFAEQEAARHAGQPVRGLSNRQRNQVQQELVKDVVLRQDARRIATGLRSAGEIKRDLAAASRGGPPARASTKSRMSPRVLAKISQETPDTDTRGAALLTALARFGLKVVIAVVRRFARKRDHGLYTTIVEEICRELYLDSLGVGAWSMIKKDTVDAFGGDATTYGGTAFVEELVAWWKPGRRITLVGHSTGAIYIGELLERLHAALPAEARCEVVWLAPACTFGFLQERLRLFRRRVAHIRVFGLSDVNERGYWEVPAVYKGSLLYMVSGLFEPDEVDMPLVGMQRYYSGQKPYDQQELLAVVRYLQARTVWSMADQGPGRTCTARKHGAFHQDRETVASLQHILAHGF